MNTLPGHPLLSDLEARVNSLPGAGLPWLAASRRRAVNHLAESGLPREREERWKYTPLRALSTRSGQWTDAPDAALDQAAIAERIALPGVDGPRLVLVNGHFHAGLSRLDGLPKGIELMPLSQAILERAEAVQPFLARAYHGSAEGFATLNAACAAEGLWLQVAADHTLEQPIHVVHVGMPGPERASAHLRLVIDVGARSRCRVIEHYAGLNDHSLMLNLVTQVRLAEHSVLRHLRLQDESEQALLVQRSEGDIHANATWRRYDIELGGQWLRHDLIARLQAAGGAFESFGVFALHGRQHADTHLRVDHLAGDCRSQSRWRGVADGRSRGVFDGQINVHRGADGSDASLSNNNLLLSPHAEIDSRPVLEIDADDVKAAHGATVGQLDDKALFYMRSRGIALSEARSLLTYAFCREVFDQLSMVELRDHLAALLVEHLPKQDLS